MGGSHTSLITDTTNFHGNSKFIFMLLLPLLGSFHKSKLIDACIAKDTWKIKSPLAFVGGEFELNKTGEL